MNGLRKRFGKSNLTADDLIEEGFSVAEIDVSVVRQREFDIITDTSGNEYNKKGHVDIKELKERPWLISDKAKAMDKQSLVNKKRTEKS